MNILLPNLTFSFCTITKYKTTITNDTILTQDDTEMQKQTAVTAYLKSKQLLLFALT